MGVAKTERKVQSPQLKNTRVTTLQADSWEAQYRNIFDGIGVLQFTYSIKLNDNARPAVHAPRRNPVLLRQDLRKELVCVRKPNGALRICMDPKDLNENILREQYKIPKREEILSELAGAQWFTKLDASHGFWQLQIDSSSTDLCTFNTPFGQYSYQTSPMVFPQHQKFFTVQWRMCLKNWRGSGFISMMS